MERIAREKDDCGSRPKATAAGSTTAPATPATDALAPVAVCDDVACTHSMLRCPYGSRRVSRRPEVRCASAVGALLLAAAHAFAVFAVLAALASAVDAIWQLVRPEVGAASPRGSSSLQSSRSPTPATARCATRMSAAASEGQARCADAPRAAGTRGTLRLVGRGSTARTSASATASVRKPWAPPFLSDSNSRSSYNHALACVF